jgi:Ion channel
MTAFLIYFISCIFYFGVQNANTQEDTDANRTFSGVYIDQNINWNNWDILALFLYFIMTTIAKIGYGDYYAISNVERIFAVLILLISMIFFSYVLDQFISIFTSAPSPKAII